ncbi:MAG: hypothetical protein AB7P94_17290 [Steroidobacteraceae bacterium]
MKLYVAKKTKDNKYGCDKHRYKLYPKLQGANELNVWNLIIRSHVFEEWQELSNKKDIYDLINKFKILGWSVVKCELKEVKQNGG